MSQNKKTYTVVYHCTNCKASRTKEIPYGTLAPSHALCENCGCHTATTELPKPVMPPYIPVPRPKPNPWPKPEKDEIKPRPWRFPDPGPYPNYPRYWCGRTTHIAVFP